MRRHPRFRYLRLVVARVLLACLCLALQPASADVARQTVDPILRLDLPGHTGEVRALAFTADSSHLISGGRDKVAIVWTLDDEAQDGGDDRLTRNIARRRLKERALRWQVARGSRGAIQALAVSPAGEPPVVAMAGSGAMGSTGEILLVDGRDGTWIKTLGGATPDGAERPGHRQSVAALAFTADGAWLVSQDLDGQAFAWKRAEDWRPVELAAREETRFGPEAARRLTRLPPVRPLAALGAGRVALPVLVSKADAETPVWKIGVFDLAAPVARPTLLPAEHFGVVTALAATSDGSKLASADLARRVHVVHPAAAVPAVQWETKGVAESLAMLPDGRQVAIGIAKGDDGPPRLEIWDVAAARRIAERQSAAAVRAICLSPDGARLAWSGDARHAINVENVASLLAQQPAGEQRPARQLGGVGQAITRVAFSTAAADARPAVEPPPGDSPTGHRNIFRRRPVAKADEVAAPAPWPHRVAVATAPGPNPPLESAFDVATLSRIPVGGVDGWAPATGRPGGWSLRRAGDEDRRRERWELVKNGKAAGVIDLALDWQGWAGADGNAVAWLSRAGQDDPWAVAIGTDRGIFVYKLEAAPATPCPLVRRFRGHEDRVLSLAVSEDGRWLASGGGDGLLMLWSLSDLERNLPLADRWGVTLDVQNGQAVVTAIDEAGPLAGKDVRAGDVIAKVSWAEGRENGRTEHVAAADIIRALTDVAWSTQVSFFTRRDGADREPFLRYPAWENLASIHLAANREWAFWTPQGYYAASANGDTLFGWLVNRGIDRLPRFFRAQQFRRKLERPDVMSRLLEAGSLAAALRATARDVPESSALVLPQQIAATPEVRILSPRAEDAAAGQTILVKAEVIVPEDTNLDRVRAYASGAVAAAEPRLVEDAAGPGRSRRRVYEWQLDLPAEDRHLLQVFAGTREGPTDVHEIDLPAKADAVPLRSREPRLYLLASGVNRYANSDRFADFGLTNLEFAVTDARAVRDSLSRGTLELYDLAANQLLADAEVTRAGWKTAVRDLAAGLAAEVEPDDLLVVFLAGHGMTNVEDGNGYAYLCHDAELRLSEANDEPVPVAAGSISWQDFESLTNVPCRKLALVDTCHSGALGPAARSVTVREFQENMIVVLAAAADDEPSQEADAWGHGAFTKILLEALSGKADMGRSKLRAATGGRRGGSRTSTPVAGSERTVGDRPDGIVSLDEVIDYVVKEVPNLTRRNGDDATAQHPTVSPEKILPFVNPPMTMAPGSR